MSANLDLGDVAAVNLVAMIELTDLRSQVVSLKSEVVKLNARLEKAEKDAEYGDTVTAYLTRDPGDDQIECRIEPREHVMGNSEDYGCEGVIIHPKSNMYEQLSKPTQIDPASLITGEIGRIEGRVRILTDVSEENNMCLQT